VGGLGESAQRTEVWVFCIASIEEKTNVAVRMWYVV
jgi:hypothetical protein